MDAGVFAALVGAWLAEQEVGALHCQQASARFLTQELAGDYLFGSRGDPSGILEKAQRLLAPQAFPP